MTQDHFSHFTDNDKETDKNYNRLWNITEVYDNLNIAYSKFYSPFKHLATDEVIVLFKRKIAFMHYIPKKHKHFGIKIYKL
jgi:hypothetical protein